jgi:hypothetical protein
VAAAAAVMALRGGGGVDHYLTGLGGARGDRGGYLSALINRYPQPAALAHFVGVGAAGIDHNRRYPPLLPYYRDLYQAPPAPAAAAAVGDNAGSSSDIEDPPLDDVPAANNPPRVAAAAAAPPPLADTPGAGLGMLWFDIAARDARRRRRRAEPSEDEDEEGSGSSRRRRRQRRVRFDLRL